MRTVSIMKKRIVSTSTMITLAVAGAVGLAPSLASAFSGTYVECLPTAGVKSLVIVKKGFDCEEKKNKLKLQLRAKDGNALDNCDAVSGGAPWDVWSEGKFGSKITAANAALIDQVEIKAKGESPASRRCCSRRRPRRRP
jgi:hypothetical protein